MSCNTEDPVQLSSWNRDGATGTFGAPFVAPTVLVTVQKDAGNHLTLVSRSESRVLPGGLWEAVFPCTLPVGQPLLLCISAREAGSQYITSFERTFSALEEAAP